MKVYAKRRYDNRIDLLSKPTDAKENLVGVIMCPPDDMLPDLKVGDEPKEVSIQIG